MSYLDPIATARGKILGIQASCASCQQFINVTAYGLWCEEHARDPFHGNQSVFTQSCPLWRPRELP